MGYDATTADSISKQLLLNIARSPSTTCRRMPGRRRSWRIPQSPSRSSSRGSPQGTGTLRGAQGLHYAVRSQQGYAWNKKAFSLLYQLFQMSVSTVVQTGPSITIAK